MQNSRGNTRPQRIYILFRILTYFRNYLQEVVLTEAPSWKTHKLYMAEGGSDLSLESCQLLLKREYTMAR